MRGGASNPRCGVLGNVGIQESRFIADITPDQAQAELMRRWRQAAPQGPCLGNPRYLVVTVLSGTAYAEKRAPLDVQTGPYLLDRLRHRDLRPNTSPTWVHGLAALRGCAGGSHAERADCQSHGVLVERAPVYSRRQNKLRAARCRVIRRRGRSCESNTSSSAWLCVSLPRVAVAVHRQPRPRPRRKLCRSPDFGATPQP